MHKPTHRLKIYIGDHLHQFEFIPHHAQGNDPAELDIHSAQKYDADENIWSVAMMHQTEQERAIWENQSKWETIPTDAEIAMYAAQFWAEKVKDTAKEKAIY